VSKWGVFTDRAGNRHVAPCSAEGEMLQPHTMWAESALGSNNGCVCEPERDEQDSYEVVHKDRERGGYNA